MNRSLSCDKCHMWLEFNRILAHHPWCVGHKSYHKALLIKFGCDGISDHASWNEAYHYWDTKLSWHSATLKCLQCSFGNFYFIFQVYMCVGKGTHVFGRHLGDMPWDQALSRKSHVYATIEERADAIVQVPTYSYPSTLFLHAAFLHPTSLTCWV